MLKFNEDSRVKIPTILHLMKLGYSYLSLKNHQWDKNNNIFTDICKQSLQKINPTKDIKAIERYLTDVKLILDNDDLGQVFYQKLLDQSNIKLIDFVNFDNNSFHVVTELTCKNGEEEFRPDITLLINGLPLVFIEVKKPNNKNGILAEKQRMDARSKNKKFKRFINITQFMIFSNNMEYDDNCIKPIQGAFYASSSYGYSKFNYFREDKHLIEPIDFYQVAESEKQKVLADNNLLEINNTDEFITNQDENTPTNRICSSLLSRDRLAFILRYALVYVKSEQGILQKHIMRYPQLFATKAIAKTLDNGIKKGIIWHTQGSGKTALTYYNVKHLTDYFQKQHIITKFYFIVDRLDLLEQAKREFSSRGLVVKTVQSKEEFAKDFKRTQAIDNNQGKLEITVVNIQKFSDDPTVIQHEDYNINIQRVYFLDEVHRSYNPQGSFLANLEQADKNAIKIGLTGTPLIAEDRKSKDIFGDYIHQYYYDASISDGYTLKLIREAISTQYQLKLRDILNNLNVKKGEGKIKDIYCKEKFVSPMLDYIINDFESSRANFEDNSIGAMVICHSSEQAKKMYELFNERLAQIHQKAEVAEKYYMQNSALILHDIGTKEDRKQWVEDFKAGKIDILFVYNMLLTGFDAPRLKKLYMGRLIQEHGLLQALTRVNRTYKDYEYGYVVDFADIRGAFDKTNQAYMAELQKELGEEISKYENLFKSYSEIEQEIEEIKDNIFEFNTHNAEIFNQQICEIDNKQKILSIKKSLTNAKGLYNIIRYQGDDELLERLDFAKLNDLLKVVESHNQTLNTKEALNKGSFDKVLINQGLEDIVFSFEKIGEEELVLADSLRSVSKQTRASMQKNLDTKDPEYISLKEELERLLQKNHATEIAPSQAELQENIKQFQALKQRAEQLNAENKRLIGLFDDDAKYMRVYKRLRHHDSLMNEFNISDRKIAQTLKNIKSDVDESVLNSNDILNNEALFEQRTIRTIRGAFKSNANVRLNKNVLSYINNLVISEYQNEFL